MTRNVGLLRGSVNKNAFGEPSIDKTPGDSLRRHSGTTTIRPALLLGPYNHPNDVFEEPHMSTIALVPTGGVACIG